MTLVRTAGGILAVVAIGGAIRLPVHKLADCHSGFMNNAMEEHPYAFDEDVHANYNFPTTEVGYHFQDGPYGILDPGHSFPVDGRVSSAHDICQGTLPEG
jgi:hypothetical protein